MIELNCERCGEVFYARTEKARLCTLCRRKKMSETAKKINLGKLGNEAYSKQQASKRKVVAKPIYEVKECPPGCIHEGRWDVTTTFCSYILNVGHRRPCPAGADCTEYRCAIKKCTEASK